MQLFAVWKVSLSIVRVFVSQLMALKGQDRMLIGILESAQRQTFSVNEHIKCKI